MKEFWDTIQPALPGLLVAIVGLTGTIVVTRSNQRAARALAERSAAIQRELADRAIEEKRVLARDDAIRARRQRLVDPVLEYVDQRMRYYATLHAASMRPGRPRYDDMLAEFDAEQAMLFPFLFVVVGDDNFVAACATFSEMDLGGIAHIRRVGAAEDLPQQIGRVTYQLQHQIAEIHRRAEAFIFGVQAAQYPERIDDAVDRGEQQPPEHES